MEVVFHLARSKRQSRQEVRGRGAGGGVYLLRLPSGSIGPSGVRSLMIMIPTLVPRRYDYETGDVLYHTTILRIKLNHEVPQANRGRHCRDGDPLRRLRLSTISTLPPAPPPHLIVERRLYGGVALFVVFVFFDADDPPPPRDEATQQRQQHQGLRPQEEVLHR